MNRCMLSSAKIWTRNSNSIWKSKAREEALKSRPKMSKITFKISNGTPSSFRWINNLAPSVPKLLASSRFVMLGWRRCWMSKINWRFNLVLSKRRTAHHSQTRTWAILFTKRICLKHFSSTITIPKCLLLSWWSWKSKRLMSLRKSTQLPSWISIKLTSKIGRIEPESKSRINTNSIWMKRSKRKLRINFNNWLTRNFRLHWKSRNKWCNSLVQFRRVTSIWTVRMMKETSSGESLASENRLSTTSKFWRRMATLVSSLITMSILSTRTKLRRKKFLNRSTIWTRSLWLPPNLISKN